FVDTSYSWIPRRRGCSVWEAPGGGLTPDYKDKAVKLVVNTGRAVATVARELGIKEQRLGRWVNASGPESRPVTGALSETKRCELSETKRCELQRLRSEKL